MKKPEFKFNLDNPFKYLYALLALACLAATYYTYAFARTQVYATISSDRSVYANQVSRAKDDIDMKRFEDLVREIENKAVH